MLLWEFDSQRFDRHELPFCIQFDECWCKILHDTVGRAVLRDSWVSFLLNVMAVLRYSGYIVVDIALGMFDFRYQYDKQNIA